MRHGTSTVSLLCGLGLLLLNSPDLGAQVVPPTAAGVVADTGLLTLGPNQVLKVTAVNPTAKDAILRFRTIAYGQAACNGAVCTHAVESQVTSASVTVAEGAAASIDIPNSANGVRGLVLSDGTELRVVAQVSDGTSNTIMFAFRIR